MAPREEKKSSKAGTIGFVVFIVGVIGFFVYGAMQPSDDPYLKQQLEPESGLKAYLQGCDEFRNSQKFPAVEKCVTEADWKWFQENAETIFKDGDPLNVTSGIDPNTAGALSRYVVLKNLVEYGPYGLGCEIRSQNVTGNDAEFVVRKTENFGGGNVYFDCKVRMTKEGKYWKVRDFGGGRAVIEKRAQAGDRVRVDPTEVAAPGGAPAPDPAATGDPAMAAADPGFAGEDGTPPEPAPAAGSPPAGGEDPTQQSAMLIQQAQALYSGKRYQECLDSLKQAYLLCRQSFGDQDPRTQKVLEIAFGIQKQLRAMGVTAANAGTQ